MTVAEYIAEFLAAQGVRHVYVVSGGMICPLLDAIDRRSEGRAQNMALDTQEVSVIPMRHEQAAGFAAEAEARMTGIPGVAMATSGPGATNLLTAIASCYFDSTPAVFITGQVPTNEQRRGDERQRGFQETDIVAMARPVTKLACRENGVRQALEGITCAFRIAQAGRPGPVLIDLPFDVQRVEIDERTMARYPIAPAVLLPRPEVELNAVITALDTLRQAARPLVLVGGGCAQPKNREPVRRLLACLNIPVVHSLMAKDVWPHSIGFIGTYGNRWANKALAACDVLLVLGSRLDVRQVGADFNAFAREKKIIQIDIDPSEAGRILPVGIAHDNLAIICALGDFARAALVAVAERGPIERQVWRSGQGRGPWWNQIAAWRATWPDTGEQTPPGVHPNAFMRELGAHLDSSFAAVVCDVGAHQMWAAQSLPLPAGVRWLTSGGHGALGWALPAAIGAALASPGRPVLCIVGDGGMMVNVQELATLTELRLPVKIVVLDNGGHGMVRQFQDQLFGGRHVATDAPKRIDGARWGFPHVIARSFGIPVCGIDIPESIGALLALQGPALLRTPIDPSAMALPKLAFGRGLDDMDP